ncbi:MAG: MarR family winged helix-turn-helix transcriptional regulator [Desulfitobacterium sp.]
MFDIDSCIFFSTNQTSKKMVDVFFTRFNITSVQWSVLYCLGKWTKMNQKEISEKLNLQSSTVVRLIDRMEKGGLLKRVNDTKDRRIVYLELTDKGNHLRETLSPEVDKFIMDISRNISDEDFKTFNTVLSQIMMNLEIPNE